MMSRNSCSKGLVRDCMKRNLWAIVLSTVGFFMAQLLPVIMTAQRGMAEHKQDLVNLSAADAAANWQGLCGESSVRCSADRMCLSSWPSSFWRSPAV